MNKLTSFSFKWFSNVSSNCNLMQFETVICHFGYDKID